MTATALFGLLVLTGVPGAPPNPDVAALLAYKDLMVVLVGKEGAAAVIFKPNADGSVVEYSFRYESANGKKQEDSGTLEERRLKAGGFDPAGVTIAAGPLKVRWSRSGAERGWIYYAPEVVTVHLAHADNFKGKVNKVADQVIPDPPLDLQRFIKK